MNAVELTPEEWEWFKHLARLRPLDRRPPRDIRRKLLELKLVEEGRGGGLAPTAEGRDVLTLVDTRPRGGWRRRESRPKNTEPLLP
jgi:hypothetical protein